MLNAAPKLHFDKPFTQQEPLGEAAIARAVEVMRTGRLHRYNTLDGEAGDVAELEAEYAAWQGVPFCLATGSGGAAMQIALRALGLKAGEPVLTNAFTLAPVPGAIAAAGGVPIFVETSAELTVDLDDLAAKFESTGAKIFLASHMRGHLADMEKLTALVDAHGARMIEDCAHTMGAAWNGRPSGNFGLVACFSTQTYKHMNSGEGGFLTTADPDVMARATVLSGSYMLYARHLARPGEEAYATARLEMPNCSSRMDNLRAAILRAQLPDLRRNIQRWNKRYFAVEAELKRSEELTIIERPKAESIVGSSIQFLIPESDDNAARDFVRRCAARGIELKWFGDGQPVGFTSRYDSWTYAPPQELPQSKRILARLMDMRIPLSFTVEDCSLIGSIIADEAS
ncbi:MAG: aminotransferase class I/II-fold pyridoxal phosphate-dependent enzyme [Pseudomonadota bacterium]